MSNLRKGMISVFVANLISLGLGLLSGFIIPGCLSHETYAMIKTFQLYASYVGLLHFGFVDGIYLAYGGKEFDSIPIKDIEVDLGTISVFQLGVSCFVIILGFVLKDWIVVLFAFSIIPSNLNAYFKCLFQAVGRFKTYSRIMCSTTFMYFVLNMIYIFVIKTDNPYVFISVYIVVDSIILIVLEALIRRIPNQKIRFFSFSPRKLLDNIKSGIFLTIGNVSSILLTSMDRWFVKILMDDIAFAQYSLAVSMENFLNTAVTPFTITLYNYFCKVNDSNRIKKIRNMVMIFAALLISSAFPVKFIILLFIPKYSDSVTTMLILFAAQLFYVVNKGIYLNVYKARKQLTKYFIKLVIVIVFGFLLNAVLFYFLNIKEAFAIGTIIASIIWLVLSSIDLKDIDWAMKEIAFVLLVEIAFFTTGVFLNPILGFFVYLSLVLLLCFGLIKQDAIRLFEILKETLISYIRKMKVKGCK